MRHGKTNNHLGRTSSHRSALLSNMASSLILHKRIETTLAKAKELKKYVEPLITKSKEDSTHSRRTVFSYLQNKISTKELFDNVADKIDNRQGGYTRIIKTGNRLGDNAEICILELVDYNMLYTNKEKKDVTVRTRRGRKSGGAKQEVLADSSTIVENKIEAKEESKSNEVIEDNIIKEETNTQSESEES